MSRRLVYHIKNSLCFALQALLVAILPTRAAWFVLITG